MATAEKTWAPVAGWPAWARAEVWYAGASAGAILTGAFLLFQVQPLICKFILPWFGGGPAVWTTCMLFFQSLLFVGYAYAHLAARAPARVQAAVHLGLIVAALACLPIAPDPAWRPKAGADPTWQVLGVLTLCVGLPYGLLASTGPLVQSWFSRAYPGRSPYRLYALSNFGSLLALVSYPFVFEPRFHLGTQVGLWSAAFWVYAGLCAACAAGVLGLSRGDSGRAEGSTAGADAAPAPAWWARALWVGLPACASLALLAATNHVCQDVAPMPFLWVAPLALYLLTFIVAFDHERWYHRRACAGLAVLAVAAVAALETFGRSAVPVPFGMAGRLGLYFATLFLMAMVCHGELVRLRPGPGRLTEFYLSISAGGALGGLFVSLVAPLAFHSYAEWPLALAACLAVAAAVLAAGARGAAARAAVGAAAAGVLAVLALGQREAETPVDAARNFYGVISVWDVDRNIPAYHRVTMMVDGVAHGRQFADPAKRDRPVSYYAPESGVGRAFDFLRRRPGASGGLRVGLVGLGVGTLAAYAEPGDSLRFYEINPEARRMAEAHFTYLKDCRGACATVLGDARLSLEREEPQRFDLLVLDAFSGHAVPAHLLTREAVEIYRRHLKPDGVLAFHVTNQFLDLRPVVDTLADHFGLRATTVDNGADQDRLVLGSRWVLLTADDALARALPPSQVVPPDPGRAVPLWTDSYNDLFGILKR